MPRTARATVAHYCYHLINRGNNKEVRFHDRADYVEFLWLMAEASDHVTLPIIGACLMPNHVHLVVQPTGDSDMARWTHWLFTTHSRRYHKKYGTTGRVWQGRYKAFAIQHDQHFLTVLRYVERNALRAKLVDQAQDWAWGSLNWRLRAIAPLRLAESPVPLPIDWRTHVNAPHTEEELAELRNSVNRQCPFGTAEWIQATAAMLGLEQSVAPLGRPPQRIVTTK
jgi:putative transposase